ncbi:Flagella accessory C family protein [Archaeoglobus veneficus SNP6]|uniref:Flagella accessory C family protein n=2 Tax=Archaeoglobus veneficus TaxID=58290 RepID=F2KP74_ARCVS|nr:Flagella accessory C family protein [Archaeoglobus veneficus SNP6]
MFKGALKKLSGSKGEKKKKDKSKKKKIEEEEFEEEVEETIEEEEGFEGFDEVADGFEEESDELESGGKITELETRIKDLENEVGMISSKLNTIKSENEEIGKRLEEIEENIRKLLGIYEMVTEGINPFATEVVGDEDGFGLFSALNKDKSKEDVPDELLSKDAESFFEDIDEEDFEEPSVSADEFNTSKSVEESPEEKFMKLKRELEASESESPQPQPQVQEDQTLPEPQLETESIEPVEQETIEAADLHTQVVQDEKRISISGPYLKAIKRDFISDILVLKWLDYLVTTFGIKRMAELLDFYVDIGWISREVKEFLINCSRGYTLRDMQFDDGMISNVPTLKDHVKSLIFISKLSGVEIKVEDIERAIREIEELEREVNEVIPVNDHGALDIGC